MITFLFHVLWFVAELLALLVDARRRECPIGYALEGVTPAGAFTCRLQVGPDDGELELVDTVRGRVYCRPSEIAWSPTHRNIGCRRI